jgi:hypothetical protein
VAAEVEKARNGKVGAPPAGLFGNKEIILLRTVFPRNKGC